ncbi:MAG: NDP-sugar synthase [Acidothermus sp.]|nr:NDP-sugar synthase [Acidothermus sp.]
MDAIILVGGRGTRLRPLTLGVPKPLLPMAGVPFLAHQLARLHAAGVDHVVLATSYRAEQFCDYFGDGARFGVQLEYVTEAEPLGTGGAIRNVADRLHAKPDEPVIVINGDILSGHDLRAQLALHAERSAAVTLHLVEVDDARSFGCVPIDRDGRVLAFLEKSPQPVTNLINAGCYVFRREVIERIPTGRAVSVERETFPELLGADELLVGYVENAYWSDIGTPAAFVRASCDLVRGVVASPALPGPPGEALVMPSADVSDAAAIAGGSFIGERVRVAVNAIVMGSVVLDGAVIESDAVVRASIVGVGARVGAGAVLDGAVIGEGSHVGERNELVGGARVWPGVVLPPVSIRFSSDE